MNVLHQTFPSPQSIAPPDCAAPTGEDRRGVARASTVLLIGKIGDGATETACLVLNLSEHGLMARLSFTPAIGQAVEVELRGLPRCTAHVRWVNGMKAGLQFARRQNLEPVFSLMSEDGQVARAPRFAVDLDAVVRLGGHQFPARIVNLSPGGVRLEADVSVEQGQTGQIMVSGRHIRLFGSVRWVEGNAFGMHFSTPMPLGNLRDCLEG